MAAGRNAPITLLLNEAQAGNESARETLAELVHDQLRTIARKKLRGRRPGGQIHTTELAHEGYLRMLKQNRVTWQNRAHFFAIAAGEMRRVLLDQARRQLADKRGGGAFHVEFDEGLAPAGSPVSLAELVTIDDAVTALQQAHPRRARVIELRAFGGLSVEETAEVLGISTATVKRDWAAAIEWLREHLG